MTAIQYKSPPIETCEGLTKLGDPCYNPAKHHIGGKALCGVHGGPILRHKAKYNETLTLLEIWNRAGCGDIAAKMTDWELRQRKDGIETIHQSNVTDVQWAKLRAALWAIDYELKRRAN